MDEIITKLPWSAIQTLSSVSHGWRHAIRSRQVYNARVSSNSTETLVIIRYIESETADGIALYSLRDKAFYQLPPMPPLNAGRSGQFVSMDDKICVLGWDPNQQDVYVLDLAGEKQWKACASMLEPRKRFACDVLDGKIYVFGGSIDPAQGRLIPVCGSEVYDPQKNVWSAITPIPSLRESHSVITVGDEMFVHGGFHFGYGVDVVNSYPKLLPREASFWEIYNPVMDSWRRVEPFGCVCFGSLFVGQGELYLVTRDGISVQDIRTNVWTHLDSISSDALGQGVEIVPYAILAVHDELFAIVFLGDVSDNDGFDSCLLRGRGFYSNNKKIVWEKVQCSFEFPHYPPFLCRIEL